MRMKLNLWADSLSATAGRSHTLATEAYTPEAMYGISMEAGTAIQKIETVFLEEAFKIQGLAGDENVRPELIMQGMFEKGGFFSNIWQAIAKAFRAVADFIGGLFGKLTAATEKNLKALKEAWILLENDPKYKKLIDGDKVSLKSDSSVKIPKAPVFTPLYIACLEASNVMTGGEDSKSRLDTLEFNKTNVMALFKTTIKDLTRNIANKSTDDAKDKQAVELVNKFLNTDVNADSKVRPLEEAAKAVNVQVSRFVQELLTGAEEAKVGGDLELTEGSSVKIKTALEKHKALNRAIVTSDMFKTSDAIDLFANTKSDAGVGSDLYAVFNIASTFKSITKPEDIKDIRAAYVDACKSTSSVTIEAKDKINETNAVIMLYKMIGATYQLTVGNPDTYTNLEKFFKSGKEKFTKLAEDYEEIAKELTSAVDSSKNYSGSEDDAKNASSIANQLSGIVGDNSRLTKFTTFFTSLSLKWYSVIDGLLTVGISNLYNLIKIVTKALEDNTVEVA